MTTKDAILKLADAVSGNTSANVATDVQALAVLAQAMTGGAPAEPLATVDDAIGYIADNYSGGGGGGGTTEFWMWNSSEDAGAVTQYVGVSRAVDIDFDDESFITEPLTVEQVTTTYEGQTIYGVHVTDVPVGSVIVVDPPQSFILQEYSLLYALESFPPFGVGNFGEAPMPLDGYVLSGTYMLESTI